MKGHNIAQQSFMFRGSENGLKEDPLHLLGVLRVRSRAKRNRANEAQTRNWEKLQGLPSLQRLKTT
jgi:hypothetical protein